ncbi:bilirubin oxidase [Setomelanomma holmii]|uniref:Bilirubin oxidase n=1 Tax=Setomelanomma holmii TaxID=210430 RepID=A0A9P4H773_9PLEO|nr:bilirubin oxidase [Setomelanomma holmii]
MKSYSVLSLLTASLTISFSHAVELLNITSSTITPSVSTTPATNDGLPRPTGSWVSPEYRWLFNFSLPVPPVKQVKFTYANNTSGANIDYYEVEVKSLTKLIYPNLPPTQLYSYDGYQPGPTFMMRKGREAVVRFINNSPTNVSTHVHGQYNRAPFDGWAADYAWPGQYKDYHYPNAQNARTIWYHDHTEYETGLNVYMGLDGFYILSDEEETALQLPSGPYDIPLSICAKQYDSNGSLVYDTNGDNGIFGDVIQVNGQPWPYLQVEPRKYRFRLLNGAVSRSFSISLQDDNNGASLNFDVIASDCGLFMHPVTTNTLAIAMGERYEIIVDFAGFEGKNITMRNARGLIGNIDFAATDMIMRFVVGSSVSDDCNNGAIPSTLRYIPPPPQTDVSKDFTFERLRGEWLINGIGWADIENRILTRPELGADEIWVLHNGNGTGVHPVHIHLVDFQVLSRIGGRNEVSPYEAAGMKDVVWLSPNETIRVVARYAPWQGVYMFHCHNLVHEDRDMLVAFNVTNLAKWGYDADTVFIDPMDPSFRAKDIVPQDFTDEAIREKLEWFWNLNAYNRTTPSTGGANMTRKARRRTTVFGE